MLGNISTNDSFASNKPAKATDFFLILKVIVYVVLFVVEIFGNSFIIHCVRTDNRLKSTTNLLVANMAVSDLIAILFAVPYKI